MTKYQTSAEIACALSSLRTSVISISPTGRLFADVFIHLSHWHRSDRLQSRLDRQSHATYNRTLLQAFDTASGHGHFPCRFYTIVTGKLENADSTTFAIWRQRVAPSYVLFPRQVYPVIMNWSGLDLWQ